MKKKLISVCSAAMLAVTVSSAGAADWSGFYVGAGLGWHWDDTDWRATSPLAAAGAGTREPSLRSSGFRFSAFGGYNWQLSPEWVGGLEAAVGFPQDNKSTVYGLPGYNPAPVDSVTVNAGSWDVAVRGRFGYLVTPTVMPYIVGGVIYRRPAATVNCPGGWPASGSWCIPPRAAEATLSSLGALIGAGVEAKFWGNWLVRLDYTYNMYGNTTVGYFKGTADDIYAGTTTSGQNLTLGLSYKF